MQTFLPYPEFDLSAESLDDKRLGKQRVETLQIMKALLTGNGWVNHPATKMWRGYEWALLLYQEVCCREWVEIREFSDTCLEKTTRLYFNYFDEGSEELPFWLGDSAFHVSHQSNLIRKDYDYYRMQFPEAPEGLDYIWPV